MIKKDERGKRKVKKTKIMTSSAKSKKGLMMTKKKRSSSPRSKRSKHKE
jgi:hypothetical protein